MPNLGLYFSNKLRAAVEYKRFIFSHNEKDMNKVVAWLTKATEYWHLLVDVTKPVYNPVPLVHFLWNEKGEDYFHRSIIEDQVITGLDWLKNPNSNK